MKLYIALKNIQAITTIDSLLMGSSGVEHFLNNHLADDLNFTHYQTILKSEKELQERSQELFYEDKPIKKLIKGVYFGNATCEHLLFTCNDIIKAIRLVKGKHWHIVFVLPPMSQSSQKRFEEVLELLDEYQCEVVFNDMGALHLSMQYPNIQKSLGRLFFKTQRNAFIDTFVQKDVSREIFDNQLSNITHAEYEITLMREMLKSMGIGRIALENLPIDSSFITQKPYLSIDVYYPHIFLACGRTCESASVTNPDGAYHPQLSCTKPCKELMMRFEISKYNGVFLNGNAYYKSETKMQFDNTIIKKTTSRLIWEIV